MIQLAMRHEDSPDPELVGECPPSEVMRAVSLIIEYGIRETDGTHKNLSRSPEEMAAGEEARVSVAWRNLEPGWALEVVYS